MQLDHEKYTALQTQTREMIKKGKFFSQTIKVWITHDHVNKSLCLSDCKGQKEVYCAGFFVSNKWNYKTVTRYILI